MNYNIDTALCIGGPCPKKERCARWVIYHHMNEAAAKGEIEFNPSVVITTPPFNYDNGCYFFMSNESTHATL